MTKTAAVLLTVGPATLCTGVAMFSIGGAVVLAGVLLIVGGVLSLERPARDRNRQA